MPKEWILNYFLILFLILGSFAQEPAADVGNLSELEKGAQIRIRMRKAMKLTEWANISNIQVTTKVQSKRGPTWNEVTTYASAEPKVWYKIKDRNVGFDGFWPWKDYPDKLGLTHRGSEREEVRNWLQQPLILFTNDQLTYLWKETVSYENQSCDRVRVLEPNDGSLLCDIWIDQDQSLVRKIHFWGRLRPGRPQHEFTYEYTSYTDIAGIRMPLKWESETRLRKVLKLELNPKLPEGFYKKPENGRYLPEYAK